MKPLEHVLHTGRDDEVEGEDRNCACHDQRQKRTPMSAFKSVLHSPYHEQRHDRRGQQSESGTER
ncbi:MAG TPA: hypothetical protein VI299_27145 [Polyangiales bacterium]